MRLFLQMAVCFVLAVAAWAQSPTNTDRPANIPSNAALPYVSDDDHVLTPGDKLSFRIVEDKDPPRSVIVTDSRELDVPYIGRVSVANQTCKQAANRFKELLEAKYYYHATVILGLDSVNKLRGKVYVEGQVRIQGPVDLVFEQKLTAGKAILIAGGFADFANKRKVKIVRGSEGGGPGKTFEVDMVDILENGHTDKDILLEPNDYVIVPARSVNF